MKTAIASLSLILALILPAPVPADDGARPLTLSESVGIALENNHTLLAEGERLKAAESGIGEATSAFLPKVDLSETYMRSDNPVAVFSAKLSQRRFTASDFAIDSLNNPSPVNDWNFRVQVVQPLFKGGKELVGLKRARLYVESASEARERARQLP